MGGGAVAAVGRDAQFPPPVPPLIPQRGQEMGRGWGHQPPHSRFMSADRRPAPSSTPKQEGDDAPARTQAAAACREGEGVGAARAARREQDAGARSCATTAPHDISGFELPGTMRLPATNSQSAA